MVHLMEWFAEKVSSAMGRGIPVDILHPKATLQVTEMMVNISSMKLEEPFQINCITGKIADNLYFNLNFLYHKQLTLYYIN